MDDLTYLGALIFDMDSTMIDSMPYHAKSWMAFARNHHINIDVAALIAEKEGIYRDLFAPEFRQVTGFKAFVILTN